ncbi:hypothetical protein ES708_09143 [subsurface metagenome]
MGKTVHPHACGENEKVYSIVHWHKRSTPTCMGKTASAVSGLHATSVHPQVCGENSRGTTIRTDVIVALRRHACGKNREETKGKLASLPHGKMLAINVTTQRVRGKQDVAGGFLHGIRRLTGPPRAPIIGYENKGSHAEYPTNETLLCKTTLREQKGEG